MADDTTGEHAEKLRRLVALERECAALRSSLGLSHRLEPTPVEAAEDAERAVHALIGLHATDFISLHAADGTYLWASPSGERLFGWHASELSGRSAYDLFHPDDLERIQQNHAQHVDRPEAEPIQYRLRTRDGAYRWVCTHSANSKDARGVPQIVCFTRALSDDAARSHPVGAREGSDAEPGLLCLCAWCKAVKGDAGDWSPIEAFLCALTGRSLTHGMCPACFTRTDEEIRRLRNRA